jgi:hypothetical protein
MAIAALGWLVFGIYVHLRPMPVNTQLGADFNNNIGIALVAQELPFPLAELSVLDVVSSRIKKMRVKIAGCAAKCID